MSDMSPWWNKAAQVAQNLLREKAVATSRHYKAMFAPDGGLSRDGEIVLADLREFCRATTTAFHPDPYVAARNAGRRDVWLRLQNFLGLDETEVRKLMEIDSGT